MLQFLDSSGLGDGGTACRYAVSFLRGDALTWWRAFARDGQSVFQHLTLDVLMSEMTRQFTDLDRELKVRDRLLSLK
jgi:intergrase/recombinase